MRQADDIKKMYEQAKIDTLSSKDKAVLEKMKEAYLSESEAEPETVERTFWRNIMKSPITKLAVAAVIIIAAALTINIFYKPFEIFPTASAAQVLADAARAVGDMRSIHIKARMRTLPGDNFALIGLEFDFVPIEMWKKVDDAGIVRWRIEKPLRVVVTDGNSTTMLMGPNHVVKGERPYPIGCFDTWCGHLMNVSGLLDSALQEAQNRSNTELCIRHADSNGVPELVLEIESRAIGDYTNDYLKNTFISDSDNRKVYCFDAETKLLKGFEVYVHTDKEDVLVFEIDDIEYDPEIDNSLFTIELPQDVILYEEPKILPDNEKYQQMTPKEAVRAFFQACADKNWDEALKFWSSSGIEEQTKEYLGGLEIVSIGEPFKSGIYAGWLVPYEIKLPPSDLNVRLSNANAAGRYVITGLFDSKMQITDEMKWPVEPDVLTGNDSYAAMSPQDVARAFFGAFSRLDWDEMQKFVPPSYVKGLKGEIEEATKRGINVREQLPSVETGEAFWSAEHSAYFVKCRQLSRIKKWNLAVRNDNPAGRYVVDGGL